MKQIPILLVVILLPVFSFASSLQDKVDKCSSHHSDISAWDSGPPPHINPQTGYQCLGTYGMYYRGRLYRCAVCGGLYDGGGF